jgi:hypothetical protein
MTARLATDCSHLYRVIDTVRGKFYIGKHGGREQRGYWGSGMRIKRHIKKYGLQDMKYEILVIADEQYILDLERRYVTDEFIKANPDCLNVCKGGMGGNLGHAPWNKGLKLPWVSEMMTKIHKGNTYRRGSKHTPETIEKLRQANLGKQAWNKGTVGIMKPWNKGLSLPERCVPAEKVMCPHCNKTGGIGAMKRWHFENCRTKE